VWPEPNPNRPNQNGINHALPILDTLQKDAKSIFFSWLVAPIYSNRLKD
jgi:hypothetical protein